MALALEVEFLSGVCFAAVGPDSDAPDWPPQPDRVFSALVATWAAHGQPDSERLALEWLEAQPVPMCEAAPQHERQSATVFVPPNDPSVHRAKLALSVLPALRKRQARRFPAARPHDARLHHYWPGEPDDATLAALQRLACDTAYVGHSASLTRCRFSRGDLPGRDALRQSRCGVYPGRLQELCAAYARFAQSADKKDRPSPGRSVASQPKVATPRANVFSDRWLVLQHIPDERGADGQDGQMPDARAAVLVARGIRIALMSGYGQLGLPVPAVVSGHAADGSPARAPHMAVVPLGFSGFTHADGHVLGFALVPPSDSGLLEDPAFRKVLRHLARFDNDDRDRRWLTIKSPQGTPRSQAFALRLSPSFEAPAGRRSLDPALYTASARRFASVTPIALDRHPKARGAARLAETAALVAAACQRIGLPEPSAVQVDRVAMPQGVPAAVPSASEPAWAGWQLPPSLAGRPLTHAVIEFSEPVAGPLLLGAGRFAGLGLCRALPMEKV